MENKRISDQEFQECLEMIKSLKNKPHTEADKLIYDYAKGWFENAAHRCEVRSVKIVPVIKIETKEGAGTDFDPDCIQYQYWTLDGMLLGSVG